MNRRIKTISQLRDSRLLYEKKIPAFGYMIVLVVAILIVTVIVWSINTPKTYIITSSGMVQSENKNYIMSAYSGEILEIHIKEGDLVEKEEVLIKIKSIDMNLQITQLDEQKKSYETQLSQYKKLVDSIKDDTNYFDSANADDSLYYTQYEAYKSQIAQNQVDVATYHAYGYTDEQIQTQLETNRAKITELYYAAIRNAEISISETEAQLNTVEAQRLALNEGQEEYAIKASETGIVHMLTDYKEGMVLQAGVAVASIASQQDKYLMVAYVSAQDTAKIHVGDKADIAISGLNQSIYGTISGEVIQIDSDITTSENKERGESTAYFKVYIKPGSTYLISKEGNKINLSNGMALEASIKYDEVTYFNYVMEALGVLTR